VGDRGTLFAIDAIQAKNISAYSTFKDEQEFVLMPGTRLRIKCNAFNFQNRLFIVDLEEMPTPAEETQG
jgi:hypothetical protein